MTIHIVERIRSVARLHGWAIGEHGTMVRDIDLSHRKRSIIGAEVLIS